MENIGDQQWTVSWENPETLNSGTEDEAAAQP